MAPVVNLKATVIPRSIVRATVLGDLMANFGLPPDVIRIAQEGFATGDITGITIFGIDFAGHSQDEVQLIFSELARDDQMSVDVSGGRSMIEALSLKFAHAVAYSVATMKRKGLRIDYIYHFPAGRTHTMSRYGLIPRSPTLYAPGYAPRQLFSVQPGRDPGITYTHATARRIR
ncbi:hypothetical protein [Pseudorhodoplanes sp.]|uniref:hypothetical protein n=1 Tax=Pseudorhodoplanes sp. TaxID=1934341 RepID=UPI003D14C2DA